MIPWLDNTKPVVVKGQAYWHLELKFYYKASLFLSLVTVTVKSPPSQPILILVFFIRPLPTEVIPNTFRSGDQCTQFVFIPPDRLMRNHQHKKFRNRKALSVFLMYSFVFLFFILPYVVFFLCVCFTLFLKAAVLQTISQWCRLEKSPLDLLGTMKSDNFFIQNSSHWKMFFWTIHIKDLKVKQITVNSGCQNKR